MKNHRPPNIGQSIAQDITQGSTNASPDSTLGHTDGLGHTGTTAHPTEPMGLKRRHFMGTALALDAAALLAACGGGGGGGDSGSTNTSGSSSGSGSGSSSASSSASSSSSSSASVSGSSSGSGSGSGSAAPQWVVTNLAGVVYALGGSVPFIDGTGGTATFSGPYGVDLDTSGNLYVADSNSHHIRKITPAGVVSSIAGVISTGGFLDGYGATARFSAPGDVAVDTSGSIYVADTSNHRIRKISSAGVVSTLAGTGVSGSANGTGGTATFYYPSGVAVDTNGTVYVGDYGNHLIRKITSAGVVSTLAGVAGAAGNLDGSGVTATFNRPIGIDVDTSGIVYVADRDNHLIRKITSDGVVSTLAGVWGVLGAANGTGGTAKFSSPTGVAVDTTGNLYVSDKNNHLIRLISPAGVVSNLAGVVGVSGSANGTGGTATFNNPYGIAVDTSGAVYVSDSFSNLIRKITPIF